MTVGAAMGAVGGLATRLRTADRCDARAGWLAASIWVVGVGARTAFAIAASNGVGPAIARFSVAHQVTGSAAWVAALVMWRWPTCSPGWWFSTCLAVGRSPAPRPAPLLSRSALASRDEIGLSIARWSVPRRWSVMRSDSGELDAALLCQPMIVAEDSGEIGQDRVVTLLGHLAVTRCGGPVRHRMSGLQGGKVRTRR